MSASELKRVIVKPFAKDKFELVQEFSADISGQDFSARIRIPAGFITNGANIPRVFWSIYPPNSPEYLSAVVVHDYLCEKAQTREDYKIADMCLKQALQMLGVNRFKIWVFYTACDLYHGFKFLFKGVRDDKR